MSLARSLHRGACAALSLLVLVSSLTCMTVACRVACDAEAYALGLSAAPADVPPCHRAPAGTAASPGKTTPQPGGCAPGAVCCSTWLHDDGALHLADPRQVRSTTPGGDPGLAPVSIALIGDPDVPFTCDAGADPPRPDLAPLLDSRASRAPPAAHSAA